MVLNRYFSLHGDLSVRECTCKSFVLCCHSSYLLFVTPAKFIVYFREEKELAASETIITLCEQVFFAERQFPFQVSSEAVSNVVLIVF